MLRQPHRMLLLQATAVTLMGACGGASPAPPPETRAPMPSEPAPGASQPAAPAGDVRKLAATASFGDLLAAARALQGPGDATPPAGCLLGRDELGFRLAADLAPALQSLPDAPASLAAQLEGDATRARVLTPWGLLGDAAADTALAVAAITAAPPTRPSEGAFVLALTDAGASLRHTARTLPGLDALPDDAIAAQLLQHHTGGDVYITAEAAVPVSRLYAVLEALPAAHRAALAVALPAGTRLPEAAPGPAPKASGVHCPDGLPDPPADATEGGLDAAALRAALVPLVERASGCLELARGPAAAGGRLVLGLRVGADGRPLHVCLVEDAIGDPQLAACVVEHARGLVLPRPQPAGFVDAHLPLSLTPGTAPAQRPVCVP